MKKLLALALVAVLALSLSACGKKDDKIVNVYNWGDYIDQDTVKLFEEETGYKVNYEMFETNEDMYTKIANAKTSYDVLVPSDYMIERLIAEDRLQKIDMKNVPNYTKIDDTFKNLAYDPGNEYSVPYMWGTVGILYNTKMVSGDIDSWTALWDEQYQGSILMMNSQRDSIGITLKMLGYSLNTTDDTELAAAKAKLIEQKPLVLAYVVDEVKDKMIAGEAALALVWAGDAVYCMGLNEDLAYAIPKEGSNIFYDAFCIPKSASNKAGAEAFINFMCRPDIAAKNALYIGYSTPSTEARALMGEDGESEVAYPSNLADYDLEVFSSLGDRIKVLDVIWTEILTSM